MARPEYRFKFGGVAFDELFSEDRLDDLIPGALNCPKRRDHGTFKPRRYYLDTKLIYHRIIASHNYLRDKERFQSCLQSFTRFMDDMDDNLIETEDILVQFLEQSYMRSQDWDSVVQDFALMRVLLNRRHFNGSHELRMGFDSWLRNWAALFTSEASLETSLQFLEFASDDDYNAMMGMLMRNLSAHDRQRLIDTRGRVNLRLEGIPSHEAIEYMRRHHPLNPPRRPQPPLQPQPVIRLRPQGVQWPQPVVQLLHPGVQLVPANLLGHGGVQVQLPPFQGFGFGGAQQNGWPNGQQGANLPAMQVRLDPGGGKQMIIGPGGVHIF